MDFLGWGSGFKRRFWVLKLWMTDGLTTSDLVLEGKLSLTSLRGQRKLGRWCTPKNFTKKNLVRLSGESIWFLPAVKASLAKKESDASVYPASCLED